MTIHMTRELRGFSLEYRFREAPNYLGLGNCTLGVFLQALTLQEANCGDVLRLRQTNLLLRLLEALTLHLVACTPYHLEKGDASVGTLLRKPLSIECRMTLGEDYYALKKEQGERYTWLKNGEKLAAYEKESISMMEQHRYTIEIEEKAREELPLCLLMAMAIDRIFYPGRGRVSFMKIERTYRLWK